MSEDKYVTRAELKEVLAEFGDRLIGHFEPRFDNLDRQMAGLQNQFDGLQGQVNELQRQVGELQSQVAELRKRVSNVETQLGGLRNEIILLQNRMQRVEVGLEKVALGIFKLQSEDEIITGHLAHHLMDIDKLKERMTVIEQEFSELKSRAQAGARA
jgi:chromosome segregation ATPase